MSALLNTTPPPSIVHTCTSLTLLVFSLLGITGAPAGSQTAAAPFTLFTAEKQEPLPTVMFDEQRMVMLNDLATPFGLTFGVEQQANRLTVLKGDTVMVLTADDGIVSVDGRLVSLPSPPVERNGAWFVPVEFIGQALALIPGPRVELRRRSELVVIGDILVPQVVARYRHDSSQSQLRLMITPASKHAIERSGDSLVLTLEADGLDLVVSEFLPDDRLIGLQHNEDRPSLTLELGDAFDTYTSTATPALGGGIELVIDLHVPEEPAAASGTPEAPITPLSAGDPIPDTDTDIPALPAFSAPPTIRAVAIDPGHGGADTGTRGPGGTLEKEITLNVARRLRTAIERQLGLRVILTRSGDAMVPLDERAAVANNSRADLFISLHANASVRETATGAEVFHLGSAEYDSETRNAFGLSSQAIPMVGGGVRVLDIVPWEMAQLRFVDHSARWAQILTEELSRQIPMSRRGLQQAPFRVLVGANMPAALIEMGFISNPGQETQLASTAFQSAIVNGLLRGIIRYRDELERGITPPSQNLGATGDDGQPRSTIQ
ncbi:MAG: N-acetylmuramoyl-L-alanine amidase [Acidobacteriota bacterium]|nr:N-acetylmuramoyl-L-alanine amidase [Acidobacteriota bacterium]